MFASVAMAIMVSKVCDLLIPMTRLMFREDDDWSLRMRKIVLELLQGNLGWPKLHAGFVDGDDDGSKNIYIFDSCSY